MSKSQRGLSYMLGDTHIRENHILPINSIQSSQNSSTFYTAGRDGVIKTWVPQTSEDYLSCNDIPLTRQDSDVDYDIDEKILKLEASVCNNPLPYSAVEYANYSVTNSFNVHIDWVNDIQLVNNEQGLVSCSSDLSMKYISLNKSIGPSSAANSISTHSQSITSNSYSHSQAYSHSMVANFPNAHTDYIKKLSSVPEQGKIISGGLDGRIVIWDLQKLAQDTHFHNSTTGSLPDSVYALAAADINLIAAGGPSNTVNLYDKRCTFVRKLLGHQDTIRSLLMRDNHIYSGSSDSTIKLWDVRTFKVLHTFEIHDDSVWSMALSPQQGTNILYSADKSGTIVQTNLTYLSSNPQSHHRSKLSDLEDLSYSAYLPPGSENASLDEKLGVSTVVAKNDNGLGVISLNVEGSSNSLDHSLWSSSSDALRRYHVPNTASLARYQYFRTCIESNYATGDDIELGGSPTDNDLDSEFYDLVSHLSVDTGIDIQSTLSATAGATPAITSDPEDDQHYNSMFLNIRGGPSTEFVNQIIDTDKPTFTTQDNNVNTSPVDILLNPIPSERITIVPFNREPLELIRISQNSIITKRMLNNKRHLVVLYMNGDIRIWDILVCKIIKEYCNTDGDISDLNKMIEARTKELDNIFNKLQTMDTFNDWCEVEIKAGKLLVMIRESMFGNVKIYYDELIEQYPFMSLDHSDNAVAKKNSKVQVSSDDRFYLSRILMNSIFRSYALYEWEFDAQLRAEMSIMIPPKGGKKALEDSMVEPTPATPSVSEENKTFKRIKMFARKSSRSIKEDKQATTSVSTINSLVEPYNTTFGSTEATTASPSVDINEFLEFNEEANQNEHPGFIYDDSVMKLLQSNRHRYKEKLESCMKTDSMLNIYSNDTKYQVNHDKIDEDGKELVEMYKPFIKTSRFPVQDLLIIITEHSPELGNVRDIFSFQLQDLVDLRYSKELCSSHKKLVNGLRLYLPRWIGQPVLYDVFPNKEGTKISFMLVECDYANLPSNKKIGGKSGKKIKKLLTGDGSIKLSSHNMLRVGKILTYVTEKFQSRTSEMKENIPVKNWLVLECKGQVLPVNFTLQTIKTKIWKKSSDIELVFRRKYDDEKID